MKKLMIVRRLKTLVANYFENRRLASFDPQPFLREQQSLFQRAELDLDRALTETGQYFRSRERTDSSMHYEVVAALVAQKSVRRILEIGTQTGRFTKFVAELDPNVEVTTIDLPSHDGRFDNATRRHLDAGGHTERSATSARLREENLRGLKNVRYEEMNSVLLTGQTRSYDLVFVDGDHTFPIVAIDAMNALRFVERNGWVLFDDLRPYGCAVSDFGGTETTTLLETLENAGVVEVFRLHKRLDPRRLIDPAHRKMIALVRKRI